QQGVIMPRVKVNGWKFRYRQAGRGPDVVFLPSSVRVAWSRPLFDALAADFRVTVHEPRAGGPPAAGWNFPDIADDLRGLQIALGLGPLSLVGHRSAGVAALHAAVLYPDVVAGLVLNEPCLPETKSEKGSDPFVLGGLIPFPTHSRSGLSGLTTSRILLIDQPVVALCRQDSTARPLCEFLQAKLPRCVAAIVPDDTMTLVAVIHEHLYEMAGIPRGQNVPPAAQEAKLGLRSHGPRAWPD